MEHIAIDLGGLKSQICVQSESGTILKEKRLRTDALAGFFKTRPSSRVVMESSCEAFSIADLAREAGHDVVVMPSAYTPVFTAGSPGKKNDVIDARGLSQASVALEVLPSVHVPSHLSRYRKDVCTTRRLLVRQRTQLCCRLRAFFRANLPSSHESCLRCSATRKATSSVRPKSISTNANQKERDSKTSI